MMESDSFFNKPLLMVAILARKFQCVNVIFKSIMFYSSDFKVTESTTGHNYETSVKKSRGEDHWF